MTIDKKIHDLVVCFNQCGFKTYASCQGHGLRLDVIRPYIAFRCEVEEAGELARLLRKDAESDDPKLHWGWSITGSFDKDFTLSYRLSTDNPWRFYYRYWRPALDHDMTVIAQMLKS